MTESALARTALDACARLPEAQLTFPFGVETHVFKVGGRMFAAAAPDGEPASITLKCDPDHGAALARKHPEISPGYHMNKRHWITLELRATVPPRLVEDLVANSYDLVVAGLPARLRPVDETVAANRVRDAGRARSASPAP
jgi:predicted DNA-binding protein (MmcQ/YjbR family)